MRKVLPVLMIVLVFSCTTKQEDAQAFLDSYTAQFVALHYASEKAEWAANTKIVPGDTLTSQKVEEANKAKAEFTGSKANIEKAKEFLTFEEELTTLQVLQLKNILRQAANNPAIVPELVKERIAAEAAQVQTLYGFDFQLNGSSITTNEIDDILFNDTDLDKRLAAWEASKEVGKELRSGLIDLRRLRNETVMALGYDNFFDYQVSEYGISSKEMTAMCDQLIQDIWPLYRELHTYARYELAKKYGEEVPDMLPAHWVPNRWGQDWSPMIEVQGLDLDGALEPKGDRWLVEQAERFYISLGFGPLPDSFYELSSLYPLPKDAGYKKNNHASAWHLDRKEDVRSLMSVVPNDRWYETTHHELGHVYYYLEYSNPEVPILLRRGANRAFHEAIGSLMGLAAMQKPFLEGVGLIDRGTETDEIQALLKEAMNYVVFMPFSAGVMTQFENELYANDLSPDAFNEKWWDLVRKYQGIVPPSERGEAYTDAASKTHINNDPGQYYDYALSFALLFQFHDYIATEILKEDPRATNYYGSKEVGDFMHSILSVGATKDWNQLLRETTGEGINAKAMLNYFAPLMDYLKEQNKERVHTLPENV